MRYSLWPLLPQLSLHQVTITTDHQEVNRAAVVDMLALAVDSQAADQLSVEAPTMFKNQLDKTHKKVWTSIHNCWRRSVTSCCKKKAKLAQEDHKEDSVVVSDNHKANMDHQNHNTDHLHKADQAVLSELSWKTPSHQSKLLNIALNLDHHQVDTHRDLHQADTLQAEVIHQAHHSQHQAQATEHQLHQLQAHHTELHHVHHQTMVHHSKHFTSKKIKSKSHNIISIDDKTTTPDSYKKQSSNDKISEHFRRLTWWSSRSSEIYFLIFREFLDGFASLSSIANYEQKTPQNHHFDAKTPKQLETGISEEKFIEEISIVRENVHNQLKNVISKTGHLCTKNGRTTNFSKDFIISSPDKLSHRRDFITPSSTSISISIRCKKKWKSYEIQGYERIGLNEDFNNEKKRGNLYRWNILCKLELSHYCK